MSRRRSGDGRWAWLHRWSALTLGVIVTVIGLSGALLVLKGPLVRWELGAMLTPLDAEGLPPASPVTWARTAVSQQTEAIRIMSVTAPQAGPIPSDAVLAFYVETTAEGHRHHLIGIDPAGGTVLGRAIFEDLWFQRLLNLHRALLAGPVGAIIITFCGVVLCLSVVSGCVVWVSGQRRGGRAWRQVLVPSLRGSTRTLVRTLHAMGGVYLTLPMVVLGVTGIFLAQPELLRPFVPSAAGLAAETPAAGSDCYPVVDVAEAVTRALEKRQGAIFLGVGAPPVPQGSFNVTLANDSVLVDAACGTVSSAPARISPRQMARAAFGTLHADLRLGLPGQVVVFIAGLALPVLFGTGLWLWLRQRRRRGQDVHP